MDSNPTPRLERRRRAVVLTRGAFVALVAALAVMSGGCGSQLSADSTCKDFLHASQPEQDDAVSKVASDMHAANAVTPLGRPNINYICANHPDSTLGDAVRATG